MALGEMARGFAGWHPGRCRTRGGMKEEGSPPGAGEGLRAGKQLFDTVSAGSHVLESRVGKEMRD